MRLFLYILLVVFIASCNQPTKPKVKLVDVLKPQDIKTEVAFLVSSYLADTILVINDIPLNCYPYFKSNYTTNLLWFNNTTLNAQGNSLYKLICNANYYGLNPSNYNLTQLNNNLDSITFYKNNINITALVNADFLLSNAYYLLGAHLNKGRFYADSLLLQTNFNKLPIDWDSLLVEGYRNFKIKETLDSLEPKFYNYKMLKQHLAIILNDKTLYQFDSIPFITETDSIKKQQLIILNLIKQNCYDSTLSTNDSINLAKAYNKLQKKWFIQPDGKLGKYTQQALTYNRQKIIKQISMAMERWRWELTMPKQYAFVNIPSFNLIVFEKDTVVMQSAVVCGKPETPTPILKSKIDHMLIYPYWNAPYSIAWKEILPAIQKDTSYIRRKNFEVIGANNQVVDYTKLPWKKYTKEYLPVKFRQRIGQENSLGIVKFNFYNPYGVYLHDTNSKRYFKTSSRAQSHGCIRLEKFTELANFLIRDDSLHYTNDSLQLYFKATQQRKINLKKTLPIYIRYYTAHADSNGLKLYLDFYKKDEEMMKLIYK